LLPAQLVQDTGVLLSPSHVRNLLLANDVWRGRPRADLRIPVRGRRKLLRRIDRLVKSGDAEDEVFYVEEADIDLNPRIGTTYMRRGKQLVVLTPGKNVKRYVAGALNARTGKVVHIVRERKNSDLFIALVEELRRRYRRAKRIRARQLHHPQVEADAAPPRGARRAGRPALPAALLTSNVIERPWKQLHDHVTRNHTHRTIDPLMEAVDEFIEGAQPFPGTKVSMLAHAA
jgi:transposase